MSQHHKTNVLFKEQINIKAYFFHFSSKQGHTEIIICVRDAIFTEKTLCI